MVVGGDGGWRKNERDQTRFFYYKYLLNIFPVWVFRKPLNYSFFKCNFNCNKINIHIPQGQLGSLTRKFNYLCLPVPSLRLTMRDLRNRASVPPASFLPFFFQK